MVMTSQDDKNSSPEVEKTNANPAKQVANENQKSPSAKAQENESAADREARAIHEAEAARQGQSGNPFLHSSDGAGRPYSPELDGKPGKEAEAKQAEVDGPANPKDSQK